jgi:hypothetical protein
LIKAFRGTFPENSQPRQLAEELRLKVISSVISDAHDSLVQYQEDGDSHNSVATLSTLIVSFGDELFDDTRLAQVGV